MTLALVFKKGHYFLHLDLFLCAFFRDVVEGKPPLGGGMGNTQSTSSKLGPGSRGPTSPTSLDSKVPACISVVCLDTDARASSSVVDPYDLDKDPQHWSMS